MGGVVQNLNDGNTRLRGIREPEHVILPVRTQAEAQRDEHEETQQSVEEETPHHRRGQNARSVLELLGHVSGSIRAQEAPQRGRDADESREASAAPAVIVLEFRKDLLGRRMLARDPQHNHEDEEADHVNDREDAFRQRKLSGAKDVEGGRGDEEEHDEECRLPQRVHARVRVPQQDQSLHQRRCELGGGRTSCHPSQGATPSYMIQISVS